MVTLMKWSIEEEEYLKENHDKLTNEEMSKGLSRPKHEIEKKLYRLGLGRQIRWTSKENEKFKKMYSLSSMAELQKEFPDKTRINIASHASYLNLKKEPQTFYRIKNDSAKATKRFTDEEEKELERLFKLGLSRREIASKFPTHKLLAVEEKLQRMRLVYLQTWTPDEDKILRIVYAESKEEILQQLSNRTWVAIFGRMRTLGLHRKQQPNQKLTDEKLKELYNLGFNDTQIARECGMANSSPVSQRRHKLGLPALEIPTRERNTYRIRNVPKEINEFLKTKDNVRKYILGLIEADMKK